MSDTRTAVIPFGEKAIDPTRGQSLLKVLLPSHQSDIQIPENLGEEGTLVARYMSPFLVSVDLSKFHLQYFDMKNTVPIIIANSPSNKVMNEKRHIRNSE
jgi:hypothetical protein